MTTHATLLLSGTALILIYMVVSLTYKKVAHPSPSVHVEQKTNDAFTPGDLIAALGVILYFSLFILNGAFSSTEDINKFENSHHLFLLLIVIIGLAIAYLPILGVLPRMLIAQKQRELSGWTGKMSVKKLLAIPVLLAFCYFAFTALLYLTGFSGFITKITGAPQNQDIVVIFHTVPASSKIILFFLISVVAPVVEEIIFRGYLYPVLKKYSGATAALITSSVLFSLVHLNMGLFIPITLMGILMAKLYDKTGSLWAPIIAHATNNAIACFLILAFPDWMLNNV